MARTRRQSARLRSTKPGRPPDPIPTGPPGAATHRAGPRSPLLPAADLSAPQRSAPGRREAWSACVDLAAAMASVVEYKGLKVGYYCGYCDSEEGKASCGEWSGRWSWCGRLTSKSPHRPPRPGPRKGTPRPCSPTPAFLSHSFLPKPLSFTFCLLASSSPKMAVLLGEGAEIAEGCCPRLRWRGRRQRRGARARAGLWAPGRRGALWGGGGFGLGCVAFGGSGPWLPGLRFRPASWNISRARISTAAAIARTSRAVAPMVSGPGWRAGKGAAASGLGGGPVSSGVAAPRADWLEGRAQPLPGCCLVERVRNAAPPECSGFRN